MGQHAILSPSGSETWENCPKSAAMQAGLPDDSNEYSDEGTAAHLLASTAIEENQDAAYFAGQEMLVGATDEGFDGAIWADDLPLAEFRNFVARRRYKMTEEFTVPIQTFLDNVRAAAGEGTIFPERRVSIEHITGEAGARGTADVIVIRGDELQIHDLKFGMGVRVSADNNKQLMKYASGALEEFDLTHGPFKKVRLFIHQPRLAVAPSEWDCTVEELAQHIIEASKKAAHALDYYSSYPAVQKEARTAFEVLTGTKLPRGFDLAAALAGFGPSTDACRWCKAKATCPGALKAAQDVAAIDFTVEPPAEAVIPESYDGLARLYHWVPYFEMLGKAVRAKTEGLLFEHNNSQEMIDLLGIKLVEGKRGNRDWSSEEKVLEVLDSMRIPDKVSHEMKLKSPAKMEKVIKKEMPRRWTKLAELVVQKEGQPSVAAATDPRPAWVPPDKSQDFDVPPPGEGAPAA